MRITIVVLIACSINSLTLSSVSAQNLKAEFLSKYRPAVAKLKECYSHSLMEVGYRHSPDEIENGYEVSAVHRYASNGKNLSFTVDSVDETDKEVSVRVASPAASFSLAESDDKDAFTVLSVDRYDQSILSLRLKGKARFAPYAFFEVAIEEYLADPRVTFTDIRNDNDKSQVEVRWTESLGDVLRSGRMTFDTKRFWALMNYEVRNVKKGENYPVSYLKGEVRYGDLDKSGCPKPVKAKYWSEIHQSMTENRVFNVEEYDFSSVLFEEVPENQFSWAYYGLVEPGSHDNGALRFWLLVATVTVIIFLGGLIGYKRFGNSSP